MLPAPGGGSAVVTSSRGPRPVAPRGRSPNVHGVFAYNIDHVAIAVRNLDEALADYERLYGAVPLSREVVAEQGVEEAMIALGGSHVQLLQPLADDTPVGRFLAARGEGLHHVAFAVADIEAALAHLATEGARLVDEVPRRGGGGHRIAFVHPKTWAGTLVELVEVSGDGEGDG